MYNQRLQDVINVITQRHNSQSTWVNQQGEGSIVHIIHTDRAELLEELDGLGHYSDNQRDEINSLQAAAQQTETQRDITVRERDKIQLKFDEQSKLIQEMAKDLAGYGELQAKYENLKKNSEASLANNLKITKKLEATKEAVVKLADKISEIYREN